MKRSEAIDIIAKRINMLSGYDGVAPTDMDLRWANHVLKDLEKIGMAPPKAKCKVENRMVDGQMALVQTYERTWEPENETKP